MGFSFQQGIEMAWFYLMLAGICEIIWPLLFKSTQGFSNLARNWPIIAVTFCIQILSFFLMSRAIKTLPVGTVYAVWTGLGSTGIAVIGMVIYHEPRTPLRMLFLFLVIVGLVGLRLYEIPPA